jgi:hypothetical protein
MAETSSLARAPVAMIEFIERNAYRPEQPEPAEAVTSTRS